MHLTPRRGHRSLPLYTVGLHSVAMSTSTFLLARSDWPKLTVSSTTSYVSYRRIGASAELRWTDGGHAGPAVASARLHRAEPAVLPEQVHRGHPAGGLGLFGGDLVLNDLEIKRHVLRESLEIPSSFDFSRGFIRELRIHIRGRSCCRSPSRSSSTPSSSSSRPRVATSRPRPGPQLELELTSMHHHHHRRPRRRTRSSSPSPAG